MPTSQGDAPEELAFGPRPVPKKKLLTLLVVLASVAVLTAGATGTWMFLRDRAAVFTLPDLEEVYGSFLTSAGANKVTVLDHDRDPKRAGSLTPASCEPLLFTTFFDQVPDRAIDGVLTFQLGPSKVDLSLFTFRYGTTDAAADEFTSIERALSTCSKIEFSYAGAAQQQMTVSRQPVTTQSKAHSQITYLVTPGEDKVFYAIQVMQFKNTVSWQFRYDYGGTDYLQRPSQDLMDQLATRMGEVIAEHR